MSLESEQEKFYLKLERVKVDRDNLDINLYEVTGYSWYIENGEPAMRIHYEDIVIPCSAFGLGRFDNLSVYLKEDTYYLTHFNGRDLFFKYTQGGLTVMTESAAYADIQSRKDLLISNLKNENESKSSD